MNRLILSPVPRNVTYKNGSYALSPTTFQVLSDNLNSYSLSKRLPSQIEAEINRNFIRKNEGYILLIEENTIKIKAADKRGLFYGIMTLRQILRNAKSKDKKYLIPCLKIEDWPEFPVRGIMLDISRDRIPTMETLTMLIDFWSELKYNQLQLYTEHTFAYSAHQIVWQGASPVTPQEARFLDSYCSDRAIELVPNQNSFGHMERWLKHQNYKHLADSPGGYLDPRGIFHKIPSTLNPLSRDSINFLSGLYRELLPNFKSNMLNIGADETYDLGQGKTKQACREIGKGRVYLNFILKIYELVKSYGKTMQFYGDIIIQYPELINELPKDVIVMDWGYEASHPFDKECEAISGTEIPFYILAGTSSWNSIGGRFENAKRNIENAVDAGMKHGALGVFVTDWGDNGHWQQLPISLPAFVYGASLIWNPEIKEILNEESELEKMLSIHFFAEQSDIVKALTILGSVYKDGIARLHNAGVLGILLQPELYVYYRDDLSRYRNHSFKDELSKIKEALKIIDNLSYSLTTNTNIKTKTRNTLINNTLIRNSKDLFLIIDEIRFTASLMLHAAKLAKELFATNGLIITEIPDTKRKMLAEELEQLIEKYKELWLIRSRPGGLNDSIGRFKKLLKLYKSKK